MSHSANQIHEMIRPSRWLERHLTQIPAVGRVLDLACGRGRHSRLLQAAGYSVLAVDRERQALDTLADLAGVETICADLEGDDWPLSGLSFSGIVVTNYLWRPRLPDVLALLAPGGVLIYETFMLGNERYGKPSRPDFLLQPEELRRVVRAAGLSEVDYFEGYSDDPSPAMRQAICARRVG